MNMTPSKNVKLITLTAIGTLLEWAEYTFYGYLAMRISNYFFPAQDVTIATIKTYAIFAIGYIMRPIGALLFGHIGDNIGRKPALIFSMLLMGIATFLIGCLPVYETWGIAAPICLLILRMLQGVAVSGEYNGAGIFLVEKVGQKNPCLAGSWVSCAAAFGMVLGGLAAFIVTMPSMPEWAWRIPFLLGGTSCIVALWLRRDITESTLFLKEPPSSHQAQPSWIETFKQYKNSFFYTAAIAAFTGIYVYILNIYIVSFLHQNVEIPTFHATFFAMFGEFIVFLSIPVMGWLADRWHPEKQYIISLGLIAFTTPVIFSWMLTGNYVYITLAMIVYGLLNGLMCGPIVKLLVDCFPVKLRYTGISFSWSLAAAIFSGTAPLIAQYLSNQVDWLMGPAYYVSFMALITFTVIIWTKPKTEVLVLKPNYSQG